MFIRKCKCGESEMGFKKDIGPYFTGECCEAKDAITASQSTKNIPSSILDGVPTENTETPDLGLLTQNQLIELCKTKGIQISKSDRKLRLLERLGFGKK